MNTPPTTSIWLYQHAIFQIFSRHYFPKGLLAVSLGAFPDSRINSKFMKSPPFPPTQKLPCFFFQFKFKEFKAHVPSAFDNVLIFRHSAGGIFSVETAETILFD